MKFKRDYFADRGVDGKTALKEVGCESTR